MELLKFVLETVTKFDYKHSLAFKPIFSVEKHGTASFQPNQLLSNTNKVFLNIACFCKLYIHITVLCSNLLEQYSCFKLILYVVQMISMKNIVLGYLIFVVTVCHFGRYLGHGSGQKFLKGRDLCHLDCNTVVMLMGCSSGAFDSRGDMEPAGIIQDYHIASWWACVPHINLIKHLYICSGRRKCWTIFYRN